MNKRSLTIEGHRTSVSLEPEFWDALKAVAAGRGVSLSSLVAEIDRARKDRSLSASLRVFVLAHYRGPG